jgi:two-component system, OmpR family, phosphate regulon sensor histidine kinase PhoR
VSDPWRIELARVLALAAASLVLGLAVGLPLLLLAAALALCLGWQLYRARQLADWLAAAEPRLEPALPQCGGIWGQVHRRLAQRLGVFSERNTELERQLDRYRQVARTLPDAAIAFNRQGEIELINHAASSLLGLREPDDLGRPVRHLIRTPEFVEYMERGWFEAPLEIASPVDPGITLSISILPYGEDDRYLLLARDTSRLTRLERVRQDFIANVSHEMKSPLTVIKGYVENLLDDEAAGKWKKPLSQIDQQTNRMCTIVDDLLMLSNLESGPVPEPLQAVDIPALIRSVISEARELSQGRHRIETDIDEGLHLAGSFSELYSAFSNVVFNAVTYTGEGGTIHIQWQRQAEGPARLAVSDTGVGIEPEHIPRLTERFYRVDQARSRELGGTGLGLAIVKHVLARHGGRLEVQSEPGKGSTFSLFFPADRVRLSTE